MSHAIYIDEPLAEGKTAFITAELVDQADLPIVKANINALTLTLYDMATLGLINSRDNQNILDTNGGSLHATDGTLTIELSPLDMVIVSALNPPPRYEHHVARIEWTYNTTRKGSCDIEFRVENSQKEP